MYPSFTKKNKSSELKFSSAHKNIPITGAFNIFQVYQYLNSSLFTGGTFDQNLKNSHEYLIQHSLKSGGTKDHFR